MSRAAAIWGAIPDRLPGFQHVENNELRAKFERAWGAAVPPKRGWHLSHMFNAMERGDLTALYVLGEKTRRIPKPDRHRCLKLLRGLEFMVVQDMYYTKTAELAHVVLPAAAGLVRKAKATVTSSERPRAGACARARTAPGGSVVTIRRSSLNWARRMGHDWGRPEAERIWNELADTQSHARRHELPAPRSDGRNSVAVL